MEAEYTGSGKIEARDTALRIEGQLQDAFTAENATVKFYQRTEHRATVGQAGKGLTIAYNNESHLRTRSYERATFRTLEDEDGFFNVWPNETSGGTSIEVEIPRRSHGMVNASPSGVELRTRGWEFARNFDGPVFGFDQGANLQRGESRLSLEPIEFGEARIEGSVDIFVENATLAVDHDSGRDRYRTGSWEDAGGPVPGAPATRRALAVVTIPDANLTVDLSRQDSLFFAKEPRWTVDGDLAFKAQEGEIEAGNESRDLGTKEVEMRGEFTMNLRPIGRGDYIDELPEPHNVRVSDALLDEPQIVGTIDRGSGTIAVNGELVGATDVKVSPETKGLVDKLLGLVALGWVIVRKLVPVAVGLLSDHPLKNGRRKRIYEQLEEKGIVHVRELQRLTDIPLGSLSHHLRVLEEAGLVESVPYSNYKAYLVSEEDLDHRAKRRLAPLANETRRRVVETLIAKEASCQDELAERLGLTQGAISRQLRKLIDAGLVERKSDGLGRYAPSPFVKRWMEGNG